MRHLAATASFLGMLGLIVAAPARAQSMIDMTAAMGVHGTLSGSGASTALAARETIMSHTSPTGGGWVDGGDFKTSNSGTSKGWASASSSSPGAGKTGWATPTSSSGGVGTKGWATATSGGGVNGKGWATRSNNTGGTTTARASTTQIPSAPGSSGATSGKPSY